MNRRFATGLVVGKFSPLHRGHILLIGEARRQCDHVVIVSYCDPEPYPASLREQWLEACCPATTRLVVTTESLQHWFPDEALLLPKDSDADDIHRQFVARLCIHVLKRRVDAVFTSEAYGDGFAEVLTRRFSEAGLGSTEVAHVEVDRERVAIPVSGTALRQDLWANWHHLPDPVAKTLVQRVALLGGESSGKSTLAIALARELCTVSVAEYGRELWQAKAGNLAFDDMVKIAREQIRREDAATAGARAFVFCDTSPLTTLFYSFDLFGRADEELVAMSRRDYHSTLLCAPDFGHVQDGTRRGRDFTMRQNGWYESELGARGTSFLTAQGSLEQRVQGVLMALRQGTAKRHAASFLT